jgi:hypothetical protein
MYVLLDMVSRGFILTEQKQTRVSLASNSPLGDVFGKPPILHDEDVAVYDSLRQRVCQAIDPHDFIEELWARDVADLFWGSLRLRRLRIKLIEGAKTEGLKRLYQKLSGKWLADSFLAKWAAGDEEAVDHINTFLAETGLDHEAIIAKTLEEKINTVEKIDRQIIQHDACRNAAIRELDRWRDAKAARRLKEIALELDQAQLLTLEPPNQEAAE